MALKSSMNILICEPDKSARIVSKSSFSKIGFKNINFCNNLKEAMEIILADLKNNNVELFMFSGEEDENSLKILQVFFQKFSPKARPKTLTVLSESDQSKVVNLIKINIKNILIRPYNQNQLVEKISDIFNQ